MPTLLTSGVHAPLVSMHTSRSLTNLPSIPKLTSHPPLCPSPLPPWSTSHSIIAGESRPEYFERLVEHFITASCDKTEMAMVADVSAQPLGWAPP
jgi:hypothetical protein